MTCRSMRGPAVLALLFPALASAQFVSIGSGGATEDFNTLATAGDSNVLPTGWALYESGGVHTTTYTADNGTLNSGNTYSYGTGTSTERAFGTIASNSNSPRIGANLRNETGGTLTELDIAYTGEQWRRGDASADKLTFEYSLNATSLGDAGATWTPFPALDFNALAGGSAGPRDGNQVANRTAIAATLTGLNVAPMGTFWIRWSDGNATGADDGLAIDDVVFGAPEDLPPTLLSSVPSDGALDFPANGTLSLQFSEAVTVSGDWFAIECDLSGTIAVADTTVGGGPDAYTIDPLVDFAPNDSCTLTLNAALIEDQDDPFDPYEGILEIAFDTIAPPPNTPPVVLSTTPINGDTAFPSFGNIVVLFNEAVTLAPEAFALNCAASQGIALSHLTSGTSFTVGTGTALVVGDTCTFTIDRTKVQDNEGASPAADTVVNFTVATSSAGTYYDEVNTSSPEQLRCSLHETIKGHTMYPYGWPELEDADEDPNDPTKILDIYRNCSFNKVSSRVGNGGAATTCGGVSNLRYNREHVWPRSLGFNNGSNDLAAHNDLHMLHLSDETFNAHRGNKPFAYCPQSGGCLEDRPITNNGDAGGNGTYPGNSNWYTNTDGNNGSYEVWHRWRGNMARAIFYMAIRYEGIASETAHDGDIPDLELTDNRNLIVGTSNTAAKAYMGLLSVLLEWHVQDPVDAREMERNEIVFGYQGNRNPFVDHPEWATAALFNSQQPTECQLGSPNLPPVAANDAYAVDEDAILVVPAPGVLGNDTDPENAALTAVSATSVANGTLQLQPNGGFTYTPAENFCGSDAFTYRAFDGNSHSAVATVALTVDCVNDVPVVEDANFDVNEDAAAGTTVGVVSASDADAGDTLSYTIESGNTGGAFALDVADGTLRVANTAALGAQPSFVLQVRVTDSAAVPASSLATITVNVIDVNQAPIVVDTLDDVQTVVNVALALMDLSVAFEDPDGDALEYSASPLPPGVTVDPATGVLSGTPTQTGIYAVVVTASDGTGNAQAGFILTVTQAPGTPIFSDGFED